MLEAFSLSKIPESTEILRPGFCLANNYIWCLYKLDAIANFYYMNLTLSSYFLLNYPFYNFVFNILFRGRAKIKVYKLFYKSVKVDYFDLSLLIYLYNWDKWFLIPLFCAFPYSYIFKNLNIYLISLEFEKLDWDLILSRADDLI